jgi:copper chaperone CopZ
MNRRVFFGGLLTLTLISFAANEGRAAQSDLTWIFVDDMHCANCAKKIARKLYTVNGVVNVQANVSKNFAVITPQAGKTLSPRALWNAVELAKFKPVKLQGPYGVYTTKPDH